MELAKSAISANWPLILCSHFEDRTFTSSGHNTTGVDHPHSVRKKSIQCLIIVRWIMVKEDQLLSTDTLGKFDGLTLRAVPPSDPALILFICVLSIVDQQVRASSKIVARGPLWFTPMAGTETERGLVIWQID